MSVQKLRRTVVLAVLLVLAGAGVKPMVPQSARVKSYYTALSGARDLSPIERAVFSVLLAAQDRQRHT